MPGAGRPLGSPEGGLPLPPLTPGRRPQPVREPSGCAGVLVRPDTEKQTSRIGHVKNATRMSRQNNVAIRRPRVGASSTPHLPPDPCPFRSQPPNAARGGWLRNGQGRAKRGLRPRTRCPSGAPPKQAGLCSNREAVLRGEPRPSPPRDLFRISRHAPDWDHADQIDPEPGGDLFDGQTTFGPGVAHRAISARR